LGLKKEIVMLEQLPVLSEYQEGLRNAKVYKSKNNMYNVIVYDGELDEEDFYSYNSLQIAENFAEDWVLRK